MTVAAINHKVILEPHTCGECGIVFAAPDYFWRRKRETGESWNCPNGHIRVFNGGKSKDALEAERLRKMLEEANRSKTQLAGDLHSARTGWNEAETKLAKAEKKAKQTLTRIHAGVCPCCNRTFQNLARHMANKHKDERL